MSRAQLSRQTFELSREAEYFSKEELTKQTTQPAEAFGGVILKELIDNGLDRCEYVKVAPSITIGCTNNGATTSISVADNADGIESEKVGKILNFATRTSDKAVYRSPTRGAQGNALKTIVGIPYALGSTKPLILEARGVRHIIRPRVDPAGKVRVLHGMEDSPVSTGTKATVEIPSGATVFDDAYWASAAALFNPHALVKLERFEKGNQQW